jgi:hypothetical protein
LNNQTTLLPIVAKAASEKIPVENVAVDFLNLGARNIERALEMYAIAHPAKNPPAQAQTSRLAKCKKIIAGMDIKMHPTIKVGKYSSHLSHSGFSAYQFIAASIIHPPTFQ